MAAVVPRPSRPEVKLTTPEITVVLRAPEMAGAASKRRPLWPLIRAAPGAVALEALATDTSSKASTICVSCRPKEAGQVVEAQAEAKPGVNTTPAPAASMATVEPTADAVSASATAVAREPVVPIEEAGSPAT